jgi:hypothetical protein
LLPAGGAGICTEDGIVIGKAVKSEEQGQDSPENVKSEKNFHNFKRML